MAATLNAGLDIELPGEECAVQIKQALDRGLTSMAMVDHAVRRVLLEKFRIGLFEKPYADEGAIALQTADAVALARQVAEQSIVVVANTGVLPLKPTQSVALIGPCADDPLALLGDYSFPVHLIMSDQHEDTDNVVTPLSAFRAAYGPNQVRYAKGVHILEQRQSGAPVFPGDVSDSTSLELAANLSTDLSGIAEAVEIAKASDVAIVCVGDLSGIFQTGTVGEGSDVDSLQLPGVQQQLLEAVVATGKPVVVVVSSGRPYNLGGLEDKVAAQVWSFFSGQQGGPALMDVLTGAVEPSGRLTLSVPKSAGAAPYFYNHKFKSSGTPIARHFGSRYPFGHGLTYTQFAYEDLQVAAPQVPSAGGEVTVSFVVRNVGDRKGVAVPQLYVRDRVSSVVRPVKELKAFARLDLSPGSAARVTLQVPTDMLSLTGRDGRRVVEPGWFDLMVGASSADILLKGQIEITGDPRLLDGMWRMESRASVKSL
ncbi:glycoside hydrolase family 3 C-terminal domain-containing protein [Devosia sp.]|jgi:hypothetical protein|uniref:glycoside hydrolase family 3 C-terminal domain-containing protein n=1 Tax=Devosia sp. TaxID=1871048 RepID=UPI0037C02468